jgi:hypothetical protein
MDSFEDRFEKSPRRTALVVVLSVVGIAFVGVVAVRGLGLLTQPLAVAERTFDADNMIANYEWFHQQYEDINANAQRLSAARDALTSFEASAGDRSTWKFDDRQEWNRLHMIVLGLEGARAEMIATYNARTEMQNRDLFRGSDLPPYINPDL